MNWDAIGAVGEVLGALVVVASVLYLGRQISQTNRIAKASVARELQDKYSNLYGLLTTDPGVLSFVTKLRNPEYRAQSEEEEERIENFCLFVAGIWLSTGAAYDQGQIDEKLYLMYSNDVRVKLQKWPALKFYMEKVGEEHPMGKEYKILRPMYE